MSTKGSVAVQTSGPKDSGSKDTVPALVMELLHCRNQLKLFHWQTMGYA